MNVATNGKAATATPPPPQSPVLHGLKLGCKRRLEDCQPLSGSKTGGMARSTTKSEKGGIHDHLARTKATLVLEDGTKLEGFSFGAERSVSGEVVFNTSMVGYPEALTDPSYRGQLLTLTFPLIGNYGVPSDVKDDLGLSVYFESETIHITALIVSEYSAESCHWNLTQSLSEWLTQNKARRAPAPRPQTHPAEKAAPHGPNHQPTWAQPCRRSPRCTGSTRAP
jgi:hypothetical protein